MRTSAAGFSALPNTPTNGWGSGQVALAGDDGRASALFSTGIPRNDGMLNSGQVPVTSRPTSL